MKLKIDKDEATWTTEFMKSRKLFGLFKKYAAANRTGVWDCLDNVFFLFEDKLIVASRHYDYYFFVIDIEHFGEVVGGYGHLSNPVKIYYRETSLKQTYGRKYFEILRQERERVMIERGMLP